MFNRFIPGAIVLGTALNLLSATNDRQCPALPAATRATLTQYVQKKYKLPPTLGLELADISVVGSTCHRKLLFKSVDQKRPFRAELYLSPDLRYLSPELLDTRSDPIEEEQRKEQALFTGLTRGNFPALGQQNAAVTLTVFSDFQCPYCAKLAYLLKNDILLLEGEKVRLIFRHFPLPNHAWARVAAEATVCAQEQSNDFFWRLHDFAFEHQQELTLENARQKLMDQTRKFKDFDHARFRRCLADKSAAARIDRDITFANESGINGTPTLFIDGRRLPSVAGSEQILTLIREQIKNQSDLASRAKSRSE